MNILIACEESQRICIEFRKKGHRAFSCDLQQCSGGHPEWHIQGNAISLLNGNCEFTTADNKKHTISGEWDMIIAHPPCTYLSNAGARFLYPNGELSLERYYKGMCGKAFFETILKAKCKRICVENPIPSKIYELPKPTQIIQPYEFNLNEPYTKTTCLWLIGLEPLIKKYDRIDFNWRLMEIVPYLPSNTGGAKRGQKHSSGIAHNAKDASKTFYGVAAAMAEQWG